MRAIKLRLTEGPTARKADRSHHEQPRLAIANHLGGCAPKTVGGPAARRDEYAGDKDRIGGGGDSRLKGVQRAVPISAGDSPAVKFGRSTSRIPCFP